MAFTINQTGIESIDEVTKVVFESPVIIEERDEETGADAVHDVAISGAPIVVVYNRSQDKTFLRLYVRRIMGTDLANLRTLMAAGEPVTVKLAAGSATTITCMFGPRKDQELRAWTSDHPDATSTGTAIPDLLLQYNARLLLFRME